MNGRAIAFVLLSSLIMMTAVILQGSFFPPAVPRDGADAVAQQDVADPLAADPADDVKSVDLAADGDNSEVETKPVENQDSTTESKPTNDLKLAAKNDTPPASDPSEVLLADNVAEELAQVTTAEPDDKFLTFGSLAAESPSRFLATINQRGGTLHRLELNFRQQKNKRLKYRDLENNGGYLGCLDCLDTDAGCVVRTVGTGTPAALAKATDVEGGIVPGDILVAIQGEPIVSADEFETRLARKTKPRTTVQLTVKRDDAAIVFDVDLIDKPIELIRPEKSRLDPLYQYPESFVLSLLKPALVDQIWPDLDRQMRTGLWEIEPSENGSQEIVLKYRLPAEQIERLGFTGPLTVIKRYRLPAVPADEMHKLDSRTFHLNLDLEIANESDQTQTVAYELDGPTGSTTETWWYANKIHGRSTAIGYIAGARDIIGSTEQQPFVFFGCAEIVKGALKKPVQVNYVCNPLLDNDTNRQLRYVGVDAQYFNVTLVPQLADDEKFRVNSVSAFTNGGEIPPKDVKLHKLADCTFQLVKTVEIEPGQTYRQTFEIFSGPKEGGLLDLYGLDDARTFGWFAWCSKPLMWLLHTFYWMTGSFSYGLAIIMLTVLVRCCMIPISRKAALNAQMMQHLQPQMKEIADKHKDDMEKRGVAQRELFKKHNYNPLSGCFMMFFQLPIFIGLYRGLSVDIALRDQPLIPGMSWCSNLSGPDQFLYWKDWMPTWLGDETGWLGPFLNILPLVTMVLFLVQQKLFMPPATDDQQKMMQKMMSFMMIFMGVMFFKVSAGLCIYFITSSLWGIIERKMLPKPVLDTEKLGLAGGTVVDGKVLSKPPTKSQQKAELKREQDLAERKIRNAERKKRLRGRG